MNATTRAPDPEGVAQRIPGAQVAFLLIHGFCADADELASLSEFLKVNGVASFSVRLAGHGSTPEALASTTRTDWLRSAERGLDFVLSWKPGLVFIAGLSMGGLLAVQLALNRKEVSGLVLISPALLVGGLLGKLLPVLKRFIRYRTVDPEKISQTFGYDLARSKYEREPLSSIHEVVKLASDVRHHLGEVRTPTLILQAGDDRTVDPRSGRLIYNGIPASTKEIQMIEGAPHVIPCHPKRVEAYPFILKFIETAGSGR